MCVNAVHRRARTYVGIRAISAIDVARGRYRLE